MPSTVQKKLKLPWKGGVLTILCDGEISTLVCDIKSNSDIHLRDFEVMKTSSVVIATIMNGLLAGHGVGQVQPRNQKAPSSLQSKCQVQVWLGIQRRHG
jgi:hypothetical protein